jgi:hypothetical protein
MNAEETEFVMIDFFMFSESGPSLRVSSHHSRLPNAVASSNHCILLPDRSTFTRAFRVTSLVRCPCNPGRGEQPRGRHISPSFELRVRLHRSKVICGIKADPFTFFSNRGHRQRSVLFSPTSGSSDNDLFEIHLCSLLCNRCSCSALPSGHDRRRYVISISMRFKKLY